MEQFWKKSIGKIVKQLLDKIMEEYHEEFQKESSGKCLKEYMQEFQ